MGTRRAAALMALATLAAAAAPAGAMPLDDAATGDVPGVDENGELDIREVLDNASAMDVRLTRQIMLLQRQISELKRRIDSLHPPPAAEPPDEDGEPGASR